MGKWKKANRHGRQRRWNKSQLIKKHGAFCMVGGHPILCMDDVTLDHILAKSLGGTDELENLQLSCYDHNQAKGNLTVEEWEVLQGA